MTSKATRTEPLGDPGLIIGGIPQDELFKWAEEHISRSNHKEDNKDCPFCERRNKGQAGLSHVQCYYCGAQTVLIDNYGRCPTGCPGRFEVLGEYKQDWPLAM